MVEVLIKKKTFEEPSEIEEIILLEELPADEEEYEIVKVKAEEKPLKKTLLKLLKKAKYIAKYFDESIPCGKC